MQSASKRSSGKLSLYFVSWPALTDIIAGIPISLNLLKASFAQEASPLISIPLSLPILELCPPHITTPRIFFFIFYSGLADGSCNYVPIQNFHLKRFLFSR